MPMTPHVEKHFMAGEKVRDIVIGMSDGLTVPFALAAGLSGAVTSSSIVVTAGLAEIAAGAIAMGLGGYLAARSDAEHYASERRREDQEIIEKPDAEKAEVRDIFLSYGLAAEDAGRIVEAMAANPDTFAEFMMRFELGLEAPDPKRALVSAVTIGLSYIAGGAIPLAPYLFVAKAASGLLASVVMTLMALLVFGFVKARLTGQHPVRGAVQTAAIGGLAAAAAFLIARAVS
jgi:VIT1/CCC1 family predicted Fe2+/Mn2+ transporter